MRVKAKPLGTRLSQLIFWCALVAASPSVAGVLQPSADFGREKVREAGSTIDLRGIERLALTRNLDLRAEVYNSRVVEQLVHKGYGIYDPEVNLSYAEGQQRDLSNFNFQSFVGATGVDTRQVDVSLARNFSPGTRLTLFFTNHRQYLFTDPSPAINPEYETELGLSLSQPLLKDFGRTVTEQEILLAAKDRDTSVEGLRLAALDLLMEVRSAYFNLLRARDALAYRTTSVKLARTVLEENRARVDAGVLPPVEVLEAEVGVQSRERDRLDAERAYRDALDQLALLLNTSETLQVGEAELGQPEIQLDEERAFSLALAKRPELQALLRQQEKLAIEERVNRNQLLPSLDLQASYSHKGVARDYADALDSVSRTDIRNWQVGVSLSYPIGNRAASAELARTRLRQLGQRASIGQMRAQVRNDIRRAIRLLEVNRAKIAAATTERRLAEEKLRTLIGRKDVGLSTTRDVLEGEEDLARARTDQIAALADYNIALSGYYRATGELLEKEGFRVQVADGRLAEQPFSMD